jgi:hypothetical protein
MESGEVVMPPVENQELSPKLGTIHLAYSPKIIVQHNPVQIVFGHTVEKKSKSLF